MKETAVKAKVLAYLGKLGPSVYAWSNPVSMYGKSGVADILCVYQGLFFSIEVKTPQAYKKAANGMTANQIKFAENINRAGGYAMVVSSVEDLVLVIGGIIEAIESQRQSEEGTRLSAQLQTQS